MNMRLGCRQNINIHACACTLPIDCLVYLSQGFTVSQGFPETVKAPVSESMRASLPLKATREFLAEILFCLPYRGGVTGTALVARTFELPLHQTTHSNSRVRCSYTAEVDVTLPWDRQDLNRTGECSACRCLKCRFGADFVPVSLRGAHIGDIRLHQKCPSRRQSLGSEPGSVICWHEHWVSCWSVRGNRMPVYRANWPFR